jgi:beta-lactamase regulating signal transducer with metallopeptidase domain
MSDWLLGTFIATSALIAAVLLVREPVRQRFGSRVAYGLWLIPTARLLMPTLTETIERAVPAASPVQPLISPAAGEPMLLTHVAPAAPSLFEQLGGWPVALVSAWLAVAAALFLSRMAAFRRDRSVILSSGTEVGRIGGIRIVQSREVASPVAFGILDRVIAIPADFERLYDERERALALEHELAHHRSGDLVANFFAFVLLCLQWFNPLAWVAHAAFRFDQEAACDARVLDKAKARDRAEYGRAIAKAASGRALLFASALDRRNTLKRRLKSMLNTPSTGKRTAGQMLVLGAIAVALPLTATRAIEYIDVPAPVAPEAPKAPEAPAAPLLPSALAVQTAAPVAPVAPTPPVAPVPPSDWHGDLQVNGDSVTINGKTKRWKDLTPAEKQHIRGEIAKARAELARTKVDRAEIDREVREALKEAQVDKEEIRRELAEARVEIDEAMREIDANAAEIRRAGQDPEAIKAQVRASLKAVEAIDVEAITRQAMASVNPEMIAASVAAAETAIARAQAEMDRVEAQLERAEEQNEDD